MQKQTIKRFSIMGIVLLAASAVTAAILPSNNSDKSDGQVLFSLTTSNGADAANNTCQPTAAISDRACQDDTATGAGSFTTTEGTPSSNQTTL